MSGQRLDKVLSEHPDIQTRSRAAKLIQSQAVLLNGKATKASAKVSHGETYHITIPQEQDSGLIAYDIPLDILFEDQDVLVVNKPAGLVVHPAAGHANDTLVNALVHHCKGLSMGFGEKRPGIVHRLDKDTSGVLVVAKNDVAQAHLVSQFKAKTTHRIYWALVYGQFSEAEGRGTLQSYLQRHPSDRKRFASERLSPEQTPKGKLAVTHYEVIQSGVKGLSLVQCQLETGRTHQIRIHLSEMGHPIIGDKLYGSNGRTKNLKSVALRHLILSLDRIGLHAAELGFEHPTTGESMFFKAPCPDDLKPIIEALGLPDEIFALS